MIALQADDVPIRSRLERQRAVRGGQAGPELHSLRRRPAGQLDAADPGWKAEVVLDPPGRSRLSAERGLVDDERVEALGRAVDGGSEARRARAHHEQVDLLTRRQLAPDAERPRHLAGRGGVQLRAAGEPHDGQARLVEALHERPQIRIVRRRGIAPGVRQPVRPDVVEHAHGRRRGVRTHDLDPHAGHLLQRLAPGDERREEQLAKRAVLEQQGTQYLAVHRDVPERLCGDSGEEHRLTGQEVQLADELRRAVPDDLVVRGVVDRDLALDDRDERVGPVADAKQHVADVRGALLTKLRERLELPGRQRRTRWAGHGSPPLVGYVQ